jgi:hypothetical protein
MSAKKRKGNDILATLASENTVYLNSKLMYFAGKQNAGQDTVGTIVSPVQAQGVVIDAAIPDTEIFSFTWRGKLRQILVKMNSVAGGDSTCTLRLLAPKAKGKWKSLSGDVALATKPGNDYIPLLRNPHGLAQWGNMLYFIDWELQKIVILGANELKGIEGNYQPVNTPYNISDEASLPGNAKGQAIIALNHRLFALYQRTDAGATTFNPSIMVRMTIGSGGALTFDTTATVGLNPQAIIPVNDGSETLLLIPHIGGRQDYNGGTNGTASYICSVPAFGSWSLVKTEVTGAAGLYDIHAVAAATRGPGSMVYIHTMLYFDGSSTAKWRIYRGTVGDFLTLTADTFTSAVSAGKLEVIDEGEIESVTYDGLYFWDLLYEQYPGPGDTGDRIWVALGTNILVTRAAAGTYGSPTIATDPEEQNPFAFYGYNGGVNVNSMDLTIDAVNQAKREVSLKRSMRGRLAPRAADDVDK